MLRIFLRAIVLGALAIAQVSCSSNKGTPAPTSSDAGTATDAGGAGTDAGVVADAGGDAGPTWAAGLTLQQTGGITLDGGAIYSSTRLAASWTAAPGTIDHYEVLATDAVANTVVDASVNGATQATLTGLKADTTYAVSVRACENAGCTTSQTQSDSAPTKRTPRETWKVHANGNNHDAGIRIVSDGNSKIQALTYGSADAGAPAARAGRMQLYYGPLPPSPNLGLTVAVANYVSDAGDVASVASFTSLAGDAGLISIQSGQTFQVMTGHPVPLSVAMGAKIRLYFEANDTSGKSRIYYIDSKDGYLGHDFNSNAPTVCNTLADYDAGGGCQATVAIGVSTDPDGGPFANVRQFRIGYPTLNDWRWGGEVGTFMFLTVDSGSCGSTAFANQAYAVWDGTRWNVSGCPKLLFDAQAPSLMHVGGVKYKLYYGVPSITTGKTGSTIPFLGPKRMIYGDGTRTGDATRVDFEDWETADAGRDIDFVWPSGQLLSAAEEGYMDDFVHVTPTGSLDFQVMYIAFSNGTDPPVAMAASLLNP